MIIIAFFLFLLILLMVILISGEKKRKNKKDAFVKIDIDNMSGYEFEQFCANVLRQNGFENVNVTKTSGDQGVDIIAVRDGIRCAIQCKRYSQNVGNRAVQEVIAGMQYYNCYIGIVMTNSYFTKSARELADKAEIILWDRNFFSRSFFYSNSIYFKESAYFLL